MASPETPDRNGPRRPPRSSRPERSDGLDHAKIVPRPTQSDVRPKSANEDQPQPTQEQIVRSIQDYDGVPQWARKIGRETAKAVGYTVLGILLATQLFGGSGKDSSGDNRPVNEYTIDGWDVTCVGEVPATIPAGGNFSNSVAQHVTIEAAAATTTTISANETSTSQVTSTEPKPELPFDVVVQAQAKLNKLDDTNTVEAGHLYQFSESCAPVFDN